MHVSRRVMYWQRYASTASWILQSVLALFVVVLLTAFHMIEAVGKKH